MRNIFKQKNKSGQTLVEALVVITVVIFGVLGTLGLLNSSLGLSRVVSDQYIAVYLASEGIEVLRNIGDANIKAGLPWDDSISECTIGVGVRCEVNPWCVVNYDDVSILSQDVHLPNGKNNPNRNPLRYDGTYYNHRNISATNNPTTFNRYICVRRIPGDSSILEVESLVTWPSRGGFETKISLVDRFYDTAL